MFLAQMAQQQDKINNENTVNHLKSEYFSTQEEQDYGMNEEINFLHEDELEKSYPNTNEEEQSDFL